MKKALDAKGIYPANPNLVISTDGTVLFAIEGARDGTGDWEWKILDTANSNDGVRSDFEVGGEADIAAGLRVRLMFTLTASGLAASPYIAVSGLTDAELDPVLCPDGILAAEVPGLCKGGDNIANNGIGWLVFLRADKDKKEDRDNNEDSDNATRLSIANKKFIHYNDEVLLPFIDAVRKDLGWKEGQPVAESMKAISWFDGDIGQLQTMVFEAREALDEAKQV